MITEDYCSFEVAKLLKEKEFDEKCRNSYNLEGKFYVHTQWYYPITTIGYVAPTHQMAMKWLRKIYGIDIVIEISDPSVKDRKYYCMIWMEIMTHIYLTYSVLMKILLMQH